MAQPVGFGPSVNGVASPRRWHPVTGALLVLLAGLLVIPGGVLAGWNTAITALVAFASLGLVAGFAVSGST